MGPSAVELLSTVLLICAVLHTFFIKVFQGYARAFPEGSVGENFFHLLGEVEIVFGLWAGVFVLCLFFFQGSTPAVEYVEKTDFSEPLFVFIIMAIASTRPIIDFAGRLIRKIAQVVPLSKEKAFYASALTVGPLLGSLITEPAAMTVTAILLRNYFFEQKYSERFKYIT